MPEGKGPRRRSIYGIGRVDDDKKSMHRWVVHIERKRRVWHRSFSDGVYGGKAKALHAARAFRDEVLVSHSPMTRAEYAAIRRKNNRSGVPGVYRHGGNAQATVRKPVGPAYWIAFWTTPDGKRAIRKFSIAKYGEKTAFKRAKDMRREALAVMDGLYVSRELQHWLRRHRG